MFIYTKFLEPFNENAVFHPRIWIKITIETMLISNFFVETFWYIWLPNKNQRQFFSSVTINPSDKIKTFFFFSGNLNGRMLESISYL